MKKVADKQNRKNHTKCPFAQSKHNLEATAVEFLPFDQQLHLVVADADMNLQVLQFDPDSTRVGGGGGGEVEGWMVEVLLPLPFIPTLSLVPSVSLVSSSSFFPFLHSSLPSSLPSFGLSFHLKHCIANALQIQNQNPAPACSTNPPSTPATPHILASRPISPFPAINNRYLHTGHTRQRKRRRRYHPCAYTWSIDTTSPPNPPHLPIRHSRPHSTNRRLLSPPQQSPLLPCFHPRLPMFS